MRMKNSVVLWACAALVPAVLWAGGLPAQATQPKETAGLPVVHLSGTPYHLGFQHGTLLRDEVAANYKDALQFLAGAEAIPALDAAWAALAPHVPADHLEEMRGLADGAGVKLEDVHRIHAVPDVFGVTCSLGAFFGPATSDGRLYQLRNLDFNREFGAQRHGAVFVVSPDHKRRFVNLAFAGFIGTLSGMNDAGISVGQVGSKSADERHQGTSFVFLLRRILEEANTAAAGAAIVQNAKRTVGINYMIASALEKRALALETTAGHFAQFEDNDPTEAKSPYAFPTKGAVFRADTAFDPEVRLLQTAGEQVNPQGNDAYDHRYLPQAEMVKAHYGHIGLDEIFALAKKIAPETNIQSVVFAYPEFWISYARGDSKATAGPYRHFNLQDLLMTP